MAYMVLTILLLTVIASIVTLDQSTTEDQHVSKKLSRKKRFLIFPDGSSFQLVLCTQNHGYLQIGDIVWFGTTAALAWELPTDPEVFDMFRDKYKVYEANRKSDVIYYVDDDGKVIDKKEYKRKVIINPAFAKRSTDTKVEKNIINKKHIMEMHNNQKINEYILIEKLDARKIDLHREERQILYAKMEKLLEALGWNGKECILQMLCHTGKLETAQGTFIEEILRAVFTLPKVHVLSEVHNQYDEAHEANGDCMKLYPNCEHSTIE